MRLHLFPAQVLLASCPLPGPAPLVCVSKTSSYRENGSSCTGCSFSGCPRRVRDPPEPQPPTLDVLEGRMVHSCPGLLSWPCARARTPPWVHLAFLQHIS